MPEPATAPETPELASEESAAFDEGRPESVPGLRDDAGRGVRWADTTVDPAWRIDASPAVEPVEPLVEPEPIEPEPPFVPVASFEPEPPPVPEAAPAVPEPPFWSRPPLEPEPEPVVQEPAAPIAPDERPAPVPTERIAAATTVSAAAAPAPASVRPPISLDVAQLAPGRSRDPDVCPFFRLEADGRLTEPYPVASADHRCIALGDEAPQSTRQQELVCLRASHSSCPRYLAATGVAERPAESRVPRATVAAIVLLLAAAGFSIGFVIQRGGIDLGAAATATPGSSAEPTATITAAGTPSPEPVVTPAPTPTSVPTASPTPAPTVEASATPSPSASSTPLPTSDRYQLLTPCPDKPDCWIYTIRSGDNLFSIARYFGVPLDTVYALNPWAQSQGIRAGQELILPPPTR